MSSIWMSFWSWLAAGWTAAAGLVILKGTAVLLLVFAAALLLRRAPASTRHLVWSAGLAAVLSVPLLYGALPLRLEVLPALDRALAANAAPTQATDLAAEAERSPAEAEHTRAEANPALGAQPQVAAGAEPLTGAAESDGVPPQTSPVAPAAQGRDARAGTAASGTAILSWLEGGAAGLALLALWALGVLLVLGRIGVGMATVRRIVRRGSHLESPDWTGPLYEAADRLDLERAPRLLLSADVPLPFTAGLVRPTVVVPESAGGWTDERRRAVLFHELAHIRRSDLFTHLLGRLACALYWFHPLVWIAARKARAEGERACDDLVLESGTRPSAYADHLLQIVRGAPRTRAPAVAIPMAQRDEFEGRMLAILEADVPRGSPGRLQAVAIAVVAGVLALSVSAMAPAEAAIEQDTSHAATEADAATGDDVAAVPAVGRTRAADADVRRGTGDTADTDAVASTDAPADPRPSPTPVQVTDAAPSARPDPVDPTSVDTPRVRTWSRGALPDADFLARIIDSTITATLGPTIDATMAAVAPVIEMSGDVAVHGGGGAHAAVGGAVVGVGDAVDGTIVEVGGQRYAYARSAGDGGGQDPELTAVWLRLLDDAEPEIRRLAAHSLGESDDPETIAALSRVLREDEDAEVRKMAAWALGEIGDAGGVPALGDALVNDASPEVRRMAAWALGEIEDPAAVDALGRAAGDGDGKVAQMALWALGEIGDARGAEHLLPALRHDDPNVRRRAAWAIGESEPASAPQPLIDALGDADAGVRKMAAWSLGEIGDPAAATALAERVDDEGREVRRMAIWAIGEIGGAAARPALMRALESGDPEIRRLAAHALAETY